MKTLQQIETAPPHHLNIWEPCGQPLHAPVQLYSTQGESPGKTLMMRFPSELCLMVPRHSNDSYIHKKLEFPASSVVQFQMLFGFRLCSLISSQLGPCVRVKAESFGALGS